MLGLVKVRIALQRLYNVRKCPLKVLASSQGQGLDMLMIRWEEGRGDGWGKNDLREIPSSFDLDHTKFYSCLFLKNTENLIRYFEM